MSFVDISDNELIYLVRASNDDARIHLINRYKRRIYGMVSSITSKFKISKFDYEDYYQESIVVFFKCLDLFDMEYNFYNYLFSALQREFKRKMIALQKNQNVLSLEYTSNEGVSLIDVVGEMDYSYEDSRVDNYINQNFSKIEQEIIKYKIKGYDCLEIAKLMGLSSKIVYKKLKDIRKTMLNGEI